MWNRRAPTFIEDSDDSLSFQNSLVITWFMINFRITEMNKDSREQHSQHTHKMSLFIKKKKELDKYHIFNDYNLSTYNLLDSVKHCFTYIQDISMKWNRCFPQKIIKTTSYVWNSVSPIHRSMNKWYCY